MTEYTKEVSVLYDDLEIVFDALKNASGLSATHDLQSQFLQVKRSIRPSPLSTQLQTALVRVTGYLHEEKAEHVQ